VRCPAGAARPQPCRAGSARHLVRQQVLPGWHPDSRWEAAALGIYARDHLCAASHGRRAGNRLGDNITYHISWPGQIFLPGYHSHLAIATNDDETETWAQISGQHDVTEAELKRANLIEDGTAVPSGSWLLVPDEKG
jgi:hypothetical protein